MFSRLLRPHYSSLFNKVRMASTGTASVPKLEGKVAIVTASTDGIGFAIARRLGMDGAKVVISSRKQKNVDSARQKLEADKIDVLGMVCHVGKDEHRKKLIEETIKHYGGLDIFVSNAAANPFMGPILDCPEEAWDKIFDTNVKATFLLCKEAIPHMEKSGGGSIVIVSSIGAYIPLELLGPYGVSKTALVGLIKAMTAQCATMKIRVNGIAPGIINTSFSQALINNPSFAKAALKQIPLGHFGEPDDCAGAVSFLASEDARYITGEIMMITGGTVSRL